MAPTSDAYKVDWIWSNNSNVHVAKDRTWFTTLTEFNSQLIDGFKNCSKVLGVGNVELEVMTDVHGTGSNTHSTIVLKDVLFVPTATCNILGGPILKEYGVNTDGSGG